MTSAAEHMAYQKRDGPQTCGLSPVRYQAPSGCAAGRKIGLGARHLTDGGQLHYSAHPMGAAVGAPEGERTDVLLTALALSDSRSLTPVQIQKAMFLIAMEAKRLAPSRFYTFEKYNYGPFAADIYSDLTGFEGRNWLVIEQPANRRVRTYQLTAQGVEAAAASGAKLDPKLTAYLQAVVKWVVSLNFQDLVRAIYKKYPEYKENSVFR
jgi:hypothetical protein